MVDTLTSARPAVQANVVELVPPESVSLANVSVALCDPEIVDGFGLQITSTFCGVAWIVELNVHVVLPLQAAVPFAANENHVLPTVIGVIVAEVSVNGPFGAAPLLLTATCFVLGDPLVTVVNASVAGT